MYITAANPEKKRNRGTHFLSRLQEAVRQVSSNTDPVTPALPSLLLHGQGLGFCLSLVTPAPSSTNPLKCGLDDVTDHSFFFPLFYDSQLFSKVMTKNSPRELEIFKTNCLASPASNSFTHTIFLDSRTATYSPNTASFDSFVSSLTLFHCPQCLLP